MIELDLAKSIDDLFEYVVTDWGLSILNTNRWVIYNSFNRDVNEKSADSYCKIPEAFLKKMMIEEYYRRHPTSKYNKNKVSNALQERLNIHLKWAIKMAHKPEYKDRLIKTKRKKLQTMDTDLSVYDLVAVAD